jgi:DNA-binding NarL/FixJ family response regulator
VYRGGSYLSPRLLTRLAADFRTHGRDGAYESFTQARFGNLTKREHEIWKMLAEGQSVKEMPPASS